MRLNQLKAVRCYSAANQQMLQCSLTALKPWSSQTFSAQKRLSGCIGSAHSSLICGPLEVALTAVNIWINLFVSQPGHMNCVQIKQMFTCVFVKSRCSPSERERSHICFLFASMNPHIWPHAVQPIHITLLLINETVVDMEEEPTPDLTWLMCVYGGSWGSNILQFFSGLDHFTVLLYFCPFQAAVSFCSPLYKNKKKDWICRSIGKNSWNWCGRSVIHHNEVMQYENQWGNQWAHSWNLDYTVQVSFIILLIDFLTDVDGK